MNIKTVRTALMALGLSAAALAADTRLEFWTFSMKPRFTPYFEAVVRNYEAANPGVKVEWADFPWDVIQTKLVTRIVAGNPPALVNLNVPWADEYARDELLTPFDSLIGRARSSFIPRTLEVLRFKGKTYGFKMYIIVCVVA